MNSFKNKDVYYLFEYAYSFQIHKDGVPILFYFEDKEVRFYYVMMKSDISDCAIFNGKIEKGKYFDLATPYGYGGPICDTPVGEESQKRFLKEITEFCKQNNIVSQFVRFHPLLRNEKLLPLVIETKYLRDTIFIDTSSRRIILENMDSKNRNMVRKALKNNIEIYQTSIGQYFDFIPMYRETMKKNSAQEYYSFSEDYFESLKELAGNACIFYAILDGKPVSGAIMLYDAKFMHYHLSGTYTDYRKLAPSNLLLYHAACWASERGIQKLHLGGGIEGNDGLFGFKKQFNKNGRAEFVVGRTIFDREKYDLLLKIRKELEPDFDEKNGYMIQYRR